MKRELPKLYQLGLAFPRLVLLAALLLSVGSFFLVRKLAFNSDFASLLPQNTESVQNLHKLEAAFGSYGYVVLTVEAPDPDLAEAFAEALAQALPALPKVDYVDYKQPVEFFKQRQWFFLEREDLQEIERRIDRSLQLQAKGVSPVFNELMDFADEENRPDLTFADIRKKYEDKLNGEVQKFNSGSDSDPFQILWVKPKQSSKDIDYNRALLAEIRKTVQGLKGEGRFASVQVGYTGEYQNTIEQVDHAKREIGWISALVTFLLLLTVVLYFRRFSAALLIGFPLMLSVLWTMALVYLWLGHLNMMTGFGAAILTGLGSDYGIFLLTRYYQERGSDRDFQKSCGLAFGNTGRATFGSMVTTVAAFGALLFSNFRVFVELGIVGALGLVMNYLAMMLIVPSLLSLAHDWRGHRWFQWFHGLDRLPNWRPFGSGNWLVRLFTPNGAWLGTAVALALTLISAFSLPAQTRIYLEDGQMDVQELPANQLNERVSRASYGTVKPGVLLVHSREEEEKLLNYLNAQIQKGDPGLVFHKALGLSSLVPTEQEAKRAELARIRAKLAQARLVNKDKKAQILESLEDSLVSPAITRDELPSEVKRLFKAKNGTETYAVLVYQSQPRTSSESIERYHRGIQQVRKDSGIAFDPVDTVFVQWDLIQLIEKEAPRGMGLIMLFFAGFLFLTIRPAKRAATIFLNLLGSLVLLSGAMWLCKLHLNVMNIAMIPIVLGTGIDCFIHYSHRFDEERDLSEIVRRDVPAIFISSLTSIIGFGGLAFASSQGLRSIGWISILGLSIVTLVCVLVFPRLLLLESAPRASGLPLKDEAVGA
ncbi:MAG: MMPL family transporter [bacterium]